jgi:hypothetical protein
MGIKEQIIQELDQIPESLLEEVLKVVRSFKNKQNSDLQQSEAWQAYLASEREREEVYRRLANS